MIHFSANLIAGATLAVGMSALAAVAPARADAFMDGVKAEVVKFAGPQSDWRGPTSAPKPDAGKLVVYMSTDEQNDASREWGQAIQEAGAKIGWKVMIVDGHGTPVGWQQGLNQAIALKADGVVTNADAASLKQIITDANDKGIVVVGIHATAFPRTATRRGPLRQHSAGSARYRPWLKPTGSSQTRTARRASSSPAIANTRSPARKRTPPRLASKECPGCQVLEFNSSPIAEVAQRQSPLVTAWCKKYGTPFYSHVRGRLHSGLSNPGPSAGGVDPKDGDYCFGRRQQVCLRTDSRGRPISARHGVGAL